ncbi:hypothetical protein PG984_009443 [Apiospora sp. TS-2023a]
MLAGAKVADNLVQAFQLLAEEEEEEDEANTTHYSSLAILSSAAAATCDFEQFVSAANMRILGSLHCRGDNEDGNGEGEKILLKVASGPGGLLARGIRDIHFSRPQRPTGTMTTSLAQFLSKSLRNDTSMDFFFQKASASSGWLPAFCMVPVATHTIWDTFYDLEALALDLYPAHIRCGKV